MQLQPVILSGGYGTRLWPLSREDYPKQLLALAGENTLFQQTINRLPNPPHIADLLVVCNEAHRFLIAEQLRALDKTATLLLEPVGRNTAPALTLSAIHIVETNPDNDAVLLVMPADHVITDQAAFHDAVLVGHELAEQGRIVTFGIVPNAPETGYGYIQQSTPIADMQDTAFGIQQFVEKPNKATAQTYLDSGQYLWNSGMFMVRASIWFDAISKHASNIATSCYEAYLQGKQDDIFYRADQTAFAQCPSDSIDYAVMEKANEQTAVIPLDAGWSDVGSWPALWEISDQDDDGNACKGDVFTHNTRNTLAFSQHRFITTIGVEDLIIVETPDAVLVADKSHAQDVKLATQFLKEQQRTEYRFHRKVHRPWGSFDSLEEDSRFKVKRLTLNPGASISLQMHYHRAEHWVVVKGTAKVTCNDKEFILTENQSTFIPATTHHRLENPGVIPLEIIEVQSGSYLGEDDIVRFQDQYNREDQT